MLYQHPFLFLMGADYSAIAIAFLISWAIGFFILRFLLRRTAVKSPGVIAAIIALLLSPIIMGLLVWGLMAIFN